MGKRTRQRRPEPAAKPVSKPTFRERIAAAGEVAEHSIESRPKAPWDPFPLAELLIFAGIVTLVTGMFVSGDTGAIVAATGFGLIGIGTLDTMIREHLAGYRAHAGMFAAVLALLVPAVSVAAVDLNLPVRLAIGIAVFGVAFPVIRRDFLRRSGGRGVL